MLRRLTTAFLLAAFLGGGGGLRPDVNPRCPHHGGSGTPAGSTAHASATNASAAAGAELFVAGPSARDGGDSHGASECDCGPSCHCCPGRRDGSLLAAAIPPGAPEAPTARDRTPALRDVAPAPAASPRLLPWPTGPPAL